ncbi:MAG: lytic transglycosylase domain-containing protein [Myxococcales bacterium]|nr:lytic transglycosylase domain-containing protein [Myxococcales bacterium]
MEEAPNPIPPILAVTGTVTFDLPVVDHDHVDFWVEHLSGRGREHFARWLSRSTRYVPLFWEKLQEYDLPKDLVFLAMVESGFSTSAYSWAHAAGPWQFMSLHRAAIRASDRLLGRRAARLRARE